MSEENLLLSSPEIEEDEGNFNRVKITIQVEFGRKCDDGREGPDPVVIPDTGSLTSPRPPGG